MKGKVVVDHFSIIDYLLKNISYETMKHPFLETKIEKTKGDVNISSIELEIFFHTHVDNNIYLYVRITSLQD